MFAPNRSFVVNYNNITLVTINIEHTAIKPLDRS